MAYNRTTTSRITILAKASSAMALAAGLALGASGPAHAQAFEGNPTVASGGVAINRTTGFDDIRVDTDQAVINWTTNDMAIGGGVINFLPDGSTALYRNNPTAQNQFTVLNRIIPTDPSRAIALNGTVISQLQTGAGIVPGGNVWFYSPGGIVVGATGVIDVGGLLLTSADPFRDGSGNFIDAGSSFTLGPAASATSYVQIDPGALILATPENSYIAMVAPIIRQNGVVDVNGSALYVGAEAATITFGGNGLFDIEVTTGTNGTVGNGRAIEHYGATTGPASSGSGDNHRIYMVAVPKNNAITLLFANQDTELGFDIAGAADTSGNSIILSAGYNVFGDTVDRVAVNPAQSASITNLIIGGPGPDITSNFVAEATNDVTAFIGASQINFASDVSIYARNNAVVGVNGAGTIAIAGDLRVSADREALAPGQSVVGGQASIEVQSGGTVTIAGDAFVSANAEGGSNLTTGSVGAGTGGSAFAAVVGNALLQIGGNLTVSANGTAGVSGAPGVGSGVGTGGFVNIQAGSPGLASNNSTLSVGGDVFAFANGFGSSNFDTGVAGIGRGGSINISSGSPTGLVSTNNLLTIGGSLLSNADGFGGSAITAGTSGAGFGGASNRLVAGIGGRIDVEGDASLTAFGFGGSAESQGSGGAGTGGTALTLLYGAGGIVNIGADLVVQATGVGGIGLGTGSVGGLGRGGNASVSTGAVAGAITVDGFTQIDALGLGGQGAQGGNGFGGLQGSGGGAFVFANGPGTVTLNNGVGISAGGIGGEANLAGAGGSGNGTGGSAQIVATANGIINVTGFTDINANGSVFSSGVMGADGGNGTGGNASISQASGGRITITGDAFVAATGQGDVNTGGGDGIAGTGTGGDVRIAVNNLNITITGSATVDASGFGGNNLGGIRGGNGIAGLANLGAGIGTLAIGGDGILRASGIGGSSFSVGSGGDGTGGQALVGTITPGAVIQIGGLVDGTANGQGGDGAGAIYAGGNGNGGIAQIFAQTGTINITGTSFLSGAAFGGNGIGDAAGGLADAGFAVVNTSGNNAQVNLDNSVFLSAFAGAGSSLGGNGNTGTATGGEAFVDARNVGSSITINGGVFADATAFGGSTNTGTIGLSTGGVAVATAQSGTLQINGDTALDASATGGNSLVTGNGGAATAGRTGMAVFGTGGGTINASGTLTQNANGFGGFATVGTGGTGTGGLTEFGTMGIIGTLSQGGSTLMRTDGFGGAAFGSGNGGTGIGGTSRAGSNGSTLLGADIELSALGIGGNGAAGGIGGNGTGGLASLVSGNGPLTGLVSFSSVFATADGFGGAGGNGVDAAIGGVGGAGGNGTGGQTLVIGSAGNGQLEIGNVQGSATGVGGFGGTGGVGLSGVGGSGGAGGIGTGGFNQIGTASGVGAEGVNIGFADILDASLQALGFGGEGGSGGSGQLGTGNGAIGGAGVGGNSTLLVRGSLVDIDNVTLISSGIGGDGGSGAVLGNGGNGTGGTVTVLVTDRFMVPAHRGILDAGNILGFAQGIGGDGAAAGQTFYAPGSQVTIQNSDATADSLVINTDGASPAPSPVVDFIAVTNGALDVGGSFTFATPGQLSVLVDNGAINADAVGLSAGNFVLPAASATNPGTITANSIGLFSGGDLVLSANLATPGVLSASAAGLITLGDIIADGVISVSGGSLSLGNLSSGNHISLFGGSVGTGAISAVNFVEIFASGGIFTSDIDAGGYIFAFTDSGDISTGSLASGQYIALETGGGDIGVGNISSIEETELDAIGSVSFGDVSTGLNFEVIADGDITGGNITSQGALSDTFYGVGFAGSGNIQVGAIQSALNIGTIGLGTFSSGALSTGESVILLVDGDIAINGGVSTGAGSNRYFYIGNSSMSSLLDNSSGNGSTFGGDPAPVFAAAPVRTLGNLSVAGAIQSGNFTVGVGTALNISGATTAGSVVDIQSSGVNIGSLTTGSNSFIRSDSNINIGNIQTGGRLVILGVTDVQTGSVTVNGDATLVSQDGTLVTGAVTGTRDILMLAEGNITTGAISGGTQPGDFIRFSGSSLFPLNTPLANFDPQAFVDSIQFTRNFGVTSILGTLTGGDTLIAARDGTVISGATNLTNGGLSIFSGGIATSSVNTTDDVFWDADTGNVTAGNLATNGFVDIRADVGSVQTGNISADIDVEIRAAQSVATGDIVANGIFTSFVTSIAIDTENGDILTGNLAGSGPIGLVARGTGGTLGSVTAGDITTTGDIMILASRNVTSGALNSSAASTGTLFIGNSSVLPETMRLATVDPSTILTTTPVATGGNVSIGGPVTTGVLLAASSGGFTASGAITAATRINLNAGGTASFGGMAAAPTITVSSGNIAISQNGGLGNANTGSLILASTGEGTTVIGGSGDPSSNAYILDGSEIQRLRAQNIAISVPGQPSQSSSPAVEIRGLTMNGSTAASGINLNGAEGRFSVQTPGTIRVTGDAIFNAMAPTNSVSLSGQRVEIAADTGGIFLNGNSLGGILSISADNIHIASASILNQLAQNINFAGRDAALGTPLTTSRPDGVIQASTLEFNVGETLFIQNSGTIALNAGFFGRVGSVEIINASDSSSQLIDVVVYGQLLDSGDIVRNGSSVRDLLFPTPPSEGFTANSSVNGCLVNAAACVGASGGVDVTAPTVVVHAGPPLTQSSSEQTEADREKEEAKAAAEEAARGEDAPRRPIMPPVSIVNTRNLGVEPVIDEPVTSGGNPNLQLDQQLPDTGGQP